MQDIRKPYTRSRSNNDLQSRVEQFEAARYTRDDYEEEPVQIPVKKRRDVDDMNMYPRRRDDALYETQEERDFPRRSGTSLTTKYSLANKKTPLGTLFFIITIVGIVVAVALYTYVFNSATVTVVPKYRDVSAIGKVFLFSKDGTNPNGIPFTVQSTSLSKSKTLSLSETRKVEAKASGIAIIYNNYDGNVQKLIKNTRFQSSKGKIYRINQSVDVPGRKGTIPGSVEVMLYADGSGADYNIIDTIFSIPGFKGTPREQAFYAKSKGSITGGSSGNVSLVSLSDLNAAKDALSLELSKELQSEILKIKKDGSIPLYSASEITYQDNENDVLKGTTDVYKITATGHVILANESKLAEGIAKNFGDYDNSPVRLMYSDTLTFTKKQSDQIVGTSSIEILVDGKPRVVWVTDSDAIKEIVQGRKRDEFKPLMKTINSIESAEINFSPLWLRSFPVERNKLTISESLPTR